LWWRSLRGGAIPIKFYIIFVITLFTTALVANDEFSYDNIFGSDTGGGESVITDNIITPFIVLGLKKNEIAINIKPDMSIASIEKAPFLKHLKTYLKPEIYTNLSQITTEYILLSDMPKGISIVMDENLNTAVDLTPVVMSDISPEIYINKPKKRNPLLNKTRSIIADVNAKFQAAELSYSIDNKMRFDNYYFSAKHNFAQEKDLFVDYLFGYEKEKYDILLCNIKPPTFAGLYANSILGLGVTNSLLSGGVVLESNPRYINLTHESEVKIYINDILEQTKTLPPGRHRLSIPVNTNKTNLKIEITDKYGRQKIIDFNFAGRNANKIPTDGQILYFVGMGDNQKQNKELYSGLQFGLNSLSKIELSTLINQQKQLLNISYYLSTTFGNIDNYLSILNEDNLGYNLKSIMNVYYDKLGIQLSGEYAKNYYNYRDNPNAKTLALDFNYRHSSLLSAGFGVENDFINSELIYDLTTKYNFNKNAKLFTSYKKTSDESKYQIGFEYKFGVNTDINNYYGESGLSSQLKHSWDNNNIVINNYNNNKSLTLNNKTNVFSNQINLDKQEFKDKTDYAFNTNFAVVATADGVDLVERVGNSAFIMLKTNEDFISNMEVGFMNKACKLEKNTTCTLKIPATREHYLTYNLDNMPMNVRINPGSDSAIFVPKSSGKTLEFTTKELFFVQGIATEHNKAISLLIGQIIAEDGSIFEIFTDEEGGFFAELLEGEYSLQIGDMASDKFIVDKKSAADGLIDVGIIKLQ
jgi:hypothetical protein